MTEAVASDTLVQIQRKATRPGGLKYMLAESGVAGGNCIAGLSHLRPYRLQLPWSEVANWLTRTPLDGNPAGLVQRRLQRMRVASGLSINRLKP